MSTDRVKQGQAMQIISRHVDGTNHRRWLCALETPDPWSFLVPPGALVEEATGRQWSSPYPVILSFWPTVFYQVCTLLKADSTDYYCNIITPPDYDGASREVKFYDLDLDVVATPSQVDLVDEEEFERRKYTYPAEWVREAVHAAEGLLAFARSGRGAFSPATAEKWRVWVREY